MLFLNVELGGDGSNSPGGLRRIGEDVSPPYAHEFSRQNIDRRQRKSGANLFKVECVIDRAKKINEH